MLIPKSFEQEIKVVMEERRMRTDDNPQSKLFERLNAVAFSAHPDRWMNDLDGDLDRRRCQGLVQRGYMPPPPNNAYAIITGDVDQAVFEVGEKNTMGFQNDPAITQNTNQAAKRRNPGKSPSKPGWATRNHGFTKAPMLRDIDKDTGPMRPVC